MTGRAPILPIAMVIVVALLAVIAIVTARSNVPELAGDTTYPHYVCTFREYCDAAGCTRDKGAFVLYTAHADGRPRIEIANMSPRITFTETEVSRLYETRGGAVEAVFQLYPNREFDMTGSATANGETEDHYATGECERLAGG